MSALKERCKILITRTDRIGDLVLSTPVFSAVRRRYPHARIEALTFIENRQVLEGNPYLDEVLLYDKKFSEKGLAGSLKFAARLSKKKYDAVVHLHATNRMHWLTFLARIPLRIGWNRRLAWALTHPHFYAKNQGRKHEAYYNFDLLKDIDVPLPQPLETYFPLPLRPFRSLQELIRQEGVPQRPLSIVLNPSASCPSKRWPARNFTRLAAKLSEKYDAVIYLIGGAGDQGISREVAEQCRARVYDLTGRLNLSMLGWLLKGASLLISNDTGPVHIASAVGTPVLSLFGRSDPGLSPDRWRPLGQEDRFIWKDVGCRPCLAHRCQINFLCLDVIPVDEVLREVEKMLEKGGRREGVRR